jgi:demethylmenaquinone methyltransferase/2-methoxy-6-polyprenyl-1,4-benzoquinol methylase
MSKNEPTIARVTRTREQAKASYDRMSRWYDLLAGRSEARCRDLALRMLGAREGETVLEIGFGTGAALTSLAGSVGPSGAVYGIDLSFGMCAVARARIKRAGAERAAPICGDAIHLPFPAGAFDALFASFTLELFDTPEIPRVLDECRRVLGTEGRLCAAAMSRERVNPLVSLYEGLHEIFPATIDCRPIYLRRALQAASYEVVEAMDLSLWGLPVEIVLARPLPPATHR